MAKFKAGDILKRSDKEYYILLASRCADERGIAWWATVSLDDGLSALRVEKALEEFWELVA